jgi:hypothetical protein
MHASHAEPMPPASPTGVFLNGWWPRARALAISTAQELRQARCGLGGHDMTLKLEKTRVSLQCMSCGYHTSGWTIQPRF